MREKSHRYILIFIFLLLLSLLCWLSIGRRQIRISCSLFIKMTDIIIFFEFLLSRLWDLFSFIYHSISKSVLHTIYFVSNIPMFAFRTSIFRNSVIWYDSFRTSILYLTNIRFISYGHPLDFFPNIRWQTKCQFRTSGVKDGRSEWSRRNVWRPLYLIKIVGIWKWSAYVDIQNKN